MAKKINLQELDVVWLTKRLEHEQMIARNMGIITGRVLLYWRSLPPEVRCHCDIEDMVSEMVLLVYSRLKAGRFNPQKAKLSTWIHTIVENQCLSLLQKHKAKKRGPGLTTGMTPEVAYKLRSPELFIALQESKQAVERFLSMASPSARDFLDAVFQGRRHKPGQDVIDEIRKLVTRSPLTFADIQLVRHCLID